MAGEYYLSVGDKFWAKYYLSHSFQEYREWEALAKAKQLKQKYYGYIDSSDCQSSILFQRKHIEGDACVKHQSINLELLAHTSSRTDSTFADESYRA